MPRSAPYDAYGCLESCRTVGGLGESPQSSWLPPLGWADPKCTACSSRCSADGSALVRRLLVAERRPSSARGAASLCSMPYTRMLVTLDSKERDSDEHFSRCGAIHEFDGKQWCAPGTQTSARARLRRDETRPASSRHGALAFAPRAGSESTTCAANRPRRRGQAEHDGSAGGQRRDPGRAH